jgi:hypothetical protein
MMLEGIAYNSISIGIKKIEASPIDNEDWPWKTGNEFIEFLAKKYTTHDLIAEAENMLSTVAQAGKLWVFADFLTEYTNLTDICEWDHAPKVRSLKSKLSQRMCDTLIVQALVPDRDE